MNHVAKPIANKYSLAIIKNAVMVCMAMNRPVAIWGGVGVGKSSLIAQLCAELQQELFDVRLSDKEPSDLGGIPFPVDQEDGSKSVTWLAATRMIPFITPSRPDVEAVLFLDEFDRCEKATENVALQLLLDRKVNGHALCPSVRTIIAGNGSSDNGTSVLSDAAATRLIHLYVDTEGQSALDSWVRWAQRSGVSHVAQGFARFNHTRAEEMGGRHSKFIELQQYTNRTRDWAFAAADYCDTLTWGHEVIEPVVFGAVGQMAGREILAYRKMYQSAPKPQDILSDPVGAAIPDSLGMMFALGQHLIGICSNMGTKEDAAKTARVAKYIRRWPEEQQAHFFRLASEDLPSIVGTPEFLAWEKEFRIV